MSAKKIVHYTGTPQIINGRAILTPVDHPDSMNVANGELATTSIIVAYDPDAGRIETLNTVYLPAIGEVA